MEGWCWWSRGSSGLLRHPLCVHQPHFSETKIKDEEGGEGGRGKVGEAEGEVKEAVAVAVR